MCQVAAGNPDGYSGNVIRLAADGICDRAGTKETGCHTHQGKQQGNADNNEDDITDGIVQGCLLGGHGFVYIICIHSHPDDPTPWLKKLHIGKLGKIAVLTRLAPVIINIARPFGLGYFSHGPEKGFTLGVLEFAKLLSVHVRLDGMHYHPRLQVVDPEIVAIGQTHLADLLQCLGLHLGRDVLKPCPGAYDPPCLRQQAHIGHLELGRFLSRLGPPVRRHSCTIPSGYFGHVTDHEIALLVLVLAHVLAHKLSRGMNKHDAVQIIYPEIIGTIIPGRCDYRGQPLCQFGP